MGYGVAGVKLRLDPSDNLLSHTLEFKSVLTNIVTIKQPGTARFGVAIVLAGIVAAGFSGPARADVIYDLTFKKGSTTVGTGVLDLNLSTIAQVENLNGSLTGILFSITTTNIDGNGAFSITPLHSAMASSTEPLWNREMPKVLW